jgi:hypothetical protein
MPSNPGRWGRGITSQIRVGMFRELADTSTQPPSGVAIMTT